MAKKTESAEWKFGAVKSDADWPKIGPSKDGGAGSQAKKSLAVIVGDDAKMKAAKAAYDKVVTAVGKLDRSQRQAVCFAAASMYTWSVLVERAKSSRVASEPTLSAAQTDMYDQIASAQGKAAAEQWKEWTLGAKRAKRAGKK